MTSGRCPAGCGRVQPAGKFLCPTCWRRVPAELQRDVYRTWRTYSSAARNAAEPEAFRKAHDAYYAAREAALAAIP